jgi:Arc/MetJ-type ribon-helix-helix transcriptional regulator
MEIQLTPDQEAFVREAIAGGRIASAEEAVAQALLLWEERERTRLEILAALDEAEADLARGDFIEITEDSMRSLADAVKQRGRARLAREQSTASR